MQEAMLQSCFSRGISWLVGKGQGEGGERRAEWSYLSLELQAMLESLLIMKRDSGIIKILNFVILSISHTCTIIHSFLSSSIMQPSLVLRPNASKEC